MYIVLSIMVVMVLIMMMMIADSSGPGMCAPPTEPLDGNVTLAQAGQQLKLTVNGSAATVASSDLLYFWADRSPSCPVFTFVNSPDTQTVTLALNGIGELAVAGKANAVCGVCVNAICVFRPLIISDSIHSFGPSSRCI